MYNTAKSRFEDKKISINVFMISSGGARVVTGRVVFSLFGKNIGDVVEQV